MPVTAPLPDGPFTPGFGTPAPDVAEIVAFLTEKGTATDAELVHLWQPNTTYAAGQSVLNPSGELVKRLVAGTSGAAYVAADWSAPASATYAARRGGTSPVAAPLVLHNVRDYGAVGDDVADDTAAIQAALNAAGVGGRVFVPPGVYKARLDVLTTPMFSVLEGSTTEFGVGGTATTEIRFSTATGAGVGIKLGTNATLSNLVLRGPGHAVGTCKGITAASARISRVSVLAWNTGIHLTNAYYARLTEVEWNRCATGLTLTGCYNVSLYYPRFSCQLDTSPQTYGVAINGAARPLNIFGGSIENYRQAVVLASAQTLGLFGVYFEVASLDTSAAGVVGAVWADGRSDVTVTAVGCFVYLNGHTRFITTSGSTDATLTAHGNHFVCVAGSVQVPSAYIVTPGQDVILSGDSWGEVALATAGYATVSTGSLAGPGLRIDWPKGVSGAYGGVTRVTTDGRARVSETVAQTLSAVGAVTFDASREYHRATLTANATSSSITNPVAGQEITITWLQDATGGRTYVWPANARFAGNVAPANTTASTRTTVRLRCDTTTDRWHEVSRAVAVPAS